MAVEVRVVQDPGEHYIMDFLTWNGNVPLWSDKWFKDSTPIKTVDDFVKICTETRAAKGLIEFIQINGHGNEYGFRIGNDWIDIKSVETFKPKLALVAPMLSKSCGVELAACEAGKAVEVVRKFSQALGGVTVVGYLVTTNGGQSPVAPPVIISPGGKPFTSPAPASGGFSQPSGPPPK
jgi:hypothetical protein